MPSQVEEPTWQQSILPHFKEQGFEARCDGKHVTSLASLQGRTAIDECMLLHLQGVYYARQSKPNEAVPGPPEGCALLMRSERLNVLASKTFR